MVIIIKELKRQFKTNVFIIGIIMTIITWTVIGINIIMLDSNRTITWITLAMGLMVASFFIGATAQLLDTAKDIKKIICIYYKRKS